MCGIATIFRYGSRTEVSDEELSNMRDCMAPRGPDGRGQWISNDRRVGLAHRRLAIVDLSERGAQPMHGGDGTSVVSYNGEIYNYPQLRQDLEEKGRTFRSDSDTEVLLHLYALYGRDMVRHLRGMYAFALWDSEHEGLFLARDPYGIKPLYISDDGSTFRAASQVKPLSQQTEVDTSIESAGHVGFFLWGHVPEPYTLYRGIRALPAGHSLWVDENGAHDPQAFEEVSDLFQEAELRATQVNGTSRHRLGEALRESVEAHLMADVDVGLFLSAGLDSATLAAIASECTDRLRTITLGFEEFQGTGEDEVPLAERLAENYGTDHETVWVTRDDFVEARDDIFQAMDQPTIDGVNSYFVSRAAADSGLKVAMSGLGGDELFGGYRSFRDIPRLVNTVGDIPGVEVLGRGIRRVTAPVLERMTSPKYAGLLELGHSYGGAYLLRRGLYMPWELPDVLDPELVEQGWNELEPRLRIEEEIDGIRSDRLRVSALESTRYMRSQLLRDTDWASMAHSLEVRVPLVDQRLLRTLGPVIAKYGLTKSDMAATPTKSLPESVRNRPKSGFTVPVREWLLSDRPEYGEERGLRGWARYVYSEFRGSSG